jgi:nucleoside-diphosphate-sugar epimerase
MRILVTGAAGFIGTNLVMKLLDDNHSVIMLDSLDDYYSPAIKRANLNLLYAHRKSTTALDTVIADILDPSLAGKLGHIGPIDALIHLAARPGVMASFENSALYTRVNLIGTQAVLDLAHTLKIKAFVFASSSSVYGNMPVPFYEDCFPRPLSPYGTSKLAAEQLVQIGAKRSGFGAVSLRIFSAYGEHMRPDLALSLFERMLTCSLPIPIYGGSRDFTHVSDVVRAFIAALYYALAHPNTHEAINIGCGHAVSIEHTALLIGELLGIKPSLRYLEPRSGEPLVTLADTDRARELLAFSPRIQFENGITELFRIKRENAAHSI